MRFSALFDKLRDGSVQQKARAYSRWTIPSLMAVPQASGAATSVVGDFQSEGALLVNGLASKLAGLLFPTTHPFMKINLSREDRASLEDILGDSKVIDAMLAEIEQTASQRVFHNASYNQLVLALKHLIVTGNAAVYRDGETGRTVCYGLDSFAVRRDGVGRVVDAVIKEFTFFELLDAETQEKLLKSHAGKFDPARPYEEAITMYTRIVRDPGAGIGGSDLFRVATQVEDIDLPTQYQGTYSEYTTPWVFPTWSLVAGENYGRGLVEDHAGGFAKLSEVSAALALYEVESLKLVNLVGSSATHSKDELAQAETGSWVSANPEDVSAYESGSTQKLAVIQQDLETTFARLSRAFMYQGNVRDAERVTAYELRQEALEVEAAMGGAFSTLAETLQLPLSHILIQEVDPELLAAIMESTGGSTVDINTGISALGRAANVQNIMQALEEGHAAVQMAREVDDRVDTYKLMDNIYQGRSVNPDDIFKSEQQMREEAEAQQAEQEAMAQMQQATAQANLAAGESEMQN